jgi:hypothetical protein
LKGITRKAIKLDEHLNSIFVLFWFLRFHSLLPHGPPVGIATTCPILKRRVSAKNDLPLFENQAAIPVFCACLAGHFGEIWLLKRALKLAKKCKNYLFLQGFFKF